MPENRRHELGPDLYNAVDKGSLVFYVHRSCFVKATRAGYLESLIIEFSARFLDVVYPVSKVTSQCYVTFI